MKSDLIVKICLLLTFAMASAGCQVHSGTGPELTAVTETGTRYALGQEIRGIVYTEPGWPQTLRADLYFPQRHGPLPIVIVIHGGGWTSRSRDDMTPISQDLAQRGYAVMNLDYRFAPKFTFPAQLDDLQQALTPSCFCKIFADI